VDRGERPIKLGDSWFSPKCIEVQRQAFSIGGRALDGLWGPTALLIPTKLRMPML
jgi:hypothetical protein